MAKTLSTMLELGTQAPTFSLPNTEGQQIDLSSFSESKALLVMFICNHCPYVIHIRETLATMTNEYMKQGVAVVAINSNDADKYPQDSLKNMKSERASCNYHFEYLFDETQEIAKKYMAACTPDFFLFDSNQELVYRGQMDDSRPGNNIENSGVDLRNALDAVLDNGKMPEKQIPSMGCNIKWKSGNEPQYFPQT